MILGSTGLLGHMVFNYLESLNKYEIINVSRSRLNDKTIIINVENKRKVKKILIKEKPNVIINCMGVLINESEEYPKRALYINGFFPKFLESLGNKLKYKLIHISTDCVFSGEKGEYSEQDHKDGTSFYAKTKALGEIINDKDLTIRTSFIGPDLKKNGLGLFNWFMKQNKEVYGYTRVYWTGLTTLELSKAIDCAIDQDLSSLYHLVPNKKISKCELLRMIKEKWKMTIEIIPDDTHICDRSLLNNRTDFKYSIPDYKDMIEELHEWMNNNNYQNYNSLYSYPFSSKMINV